MLKIEILQQVLTLKMDMVATLTLSILLLFLGNFLKKNVRVFERFCIPAPVIGGLLFSILILILRQSNLISIDMDTTFQTDRKSTRLNSSHANISYAVFCLKKKLYHTF